MLAVQQARRENAAAAAAVAAAHAELHRASDPMHRWPLPGIATPNPPDQRARCQGSPPSAPRCAFPRRRRRKCSPLPAMGGSATEQDGRGVSTSGVCQSTRRCDGVPTRSPQAHVALHTEHPDAVHAGVQALHNRADGLVGLPDQQQSHDASVCSESEHCHNQA
jgi:hypothetical protein